MIDQEIQKVINDVNGRLQQLTDNPTLPDHQHNAFDSTRIEYIDINQKKIDFLHTIYGTNAATATNYGVIYIVPVACVITGFQEVHQTAGTNGSAVTLNLEKLTGTEALDSGDEVLSTALSLKATINLVQDGVLSMTLANRSLKKGDRLALKDSGVLTDVSGVTIKIKLTVI